MSKNKHRDHGTAAVADNPNNAEGTESPVSEVQHDAANDEQLENLGAELEAAAESAVHPAVEADGAEHAAPKVDAAAIEAIKSKLSPDELRTLETLQAEVAALSKPRKVASGSKARPNVIYTLLSQPPQWSDTPQVAQIEKILFGQPKKEMTEPEIFDLIKAGAESGILRTKQNPVRIFQYYRSDLIKGNVLRYQ